MWFEFLVKFNQNVKGLHFAPHKICAVLEKSAVGISESFEEKQVPLSHCFSTQINPLAGVLGGMHWIWGPKIQVVT